MENRHWRWLGIILICLLFSGISYAYGFEQGSKATFSFFISLVHYTVDNGILRIEVSQDKFDKFFNLAQAYCQKSKINSKTYSLDCGTDSNGNSLLGEK